MSAEGCDENQLLRLAVVGQEIEPCARSGREPGGTRVIRKVVADAERIALELVDGGEGLALAKEDESVAPDLEEQRDQGRGGASS